MKRILALTAAVALSALFDWPAGAAPAGPQVRIRQIDASGFPNVSVTALFGGPVSADSISVTEDGSPVDIASVRSLSESGRTFDVVLAIDTSDSVAGAPLHAALDAAGQFVDGVTPDVALGVVTFSDRPRVVERLTQERSGDRRALDSISGTQHGTALYDAVARAAQLFSGPAQHNVVLLTDGADVGSRLTLHAAIAAARRSHVSVFSIGLGKRADGGILRNLAGGTGGTYVPAAEANLSQIYERLAEQLSQQYVVTYRSQSAAGAQVTVGVTAGGGTDESFVLMPRRPVQGPAPTGGGFHLSLTGVIGLVLVLGLSFLAVFAAFALLFGTTARMRKEKELARRMAAPSAEPAGTEQRGEGRGRSEWLPEPLARMGSALAETGGFDATLERRLERAGIPMTPGEFLAAAILGSVAGLLIGALTQNVLLALGLALLAALAPFAILGRMESRRIGQLHDQLPEVLMILASSMRAGHSFLQALDSVSKEVSEPSATEFARVVTEIRLGRPAGEALSALAERVATEEFKWAVLAINVQRDVGGNLAEILDTLSETVRERMALHRQIKVLSAEARLSMKVMIALPPLLTLYIIKVNPGYMSLLWQRRIGVGMIIVASVLMAFGVILMRKLVKINV